MQYAVYYILLSYTIPYTCCLLIYHLSCIVLYDIYDLYYHVWLRQELQWGSYTNESERATESVEDRWNNFGSVWSEARTRVNYITPLHQAASRNARHEANGTSKKRTSSFCGMSLLSFVLRGLDP